MVVILSVIRKRKRLVVIEIAYLHDSFGPRLSTLLHIWTTLGAEIASNPIDSKFMAESSVSRKSTVPSHIDQVGD